MGLFTRFRYSFIDGLVYLLLFTSLGALLIIAKDVRNNARWIGLNNATGDAIVISIEEPLSELVLTMKISYFFLMAYIKYQAIGK